MNHLLNVIRAQRSTLCWEVTLLVWRAKHGKAALQLGVSWDPLKPGAGCWVPAAGAAGAGGAGANPPAQGGSCQSQQVLRRAACLGSELWPSTALLWAGAAAFVGQCHWHRDSDGADGTCWMFSWDFWHSRSCLQESDKVARVIRLCLSVQGKQIFQCF